MKSRLVTGLSFCLCSVVPAVSEEPALDVIDGFRADLFATDDQAHDIHSLTFNSLGQLVVSGPGYVRILMDTDEDGRADRVRTFANAPKTGAQGMFFLGHHLVCSGDAGLQIFRDDNRDGRADGDPEIFLRVKAGGEHHVHAIRKGPDGWWYVIAGNMSGVSAAYATLDTSPVKQPESGTLLRLKPDLSGGEIVADGMRNAYDFDFSTDGDVYTFDSDGERDVSLPWYEPTRVFHLTPRSHSGWISRSWKRPGSFPEMPPVTASFGRGSPSGVVCYRHTRFPLKYHGALFLLDWTFGRILALPLTQNGSVAATDPIDFATGSGQYGFAPTDLAVSPDGDLYVSIGGRGTQGGVFRITWTPAAEESSADDDPLAIPSTDADVVDSVLNAPQPGASWSRVRWLPRARRLGATPFENVVTDTSRSPAERMRAIEVLTEVFNGLSSEALDALAADSSGRVRARAIWSLGRSRAGQMPAGLLAKWLNDEDPLVLRAALETLSTQIGPASVGPALQGLASAMMADDRFVRAAAATAAARLSSEDWDRLKSLFAQNHAGRVTAELGRHARTTEVVMSAVEAAMPVLLEPEWSDRQKIDAVRLIQVALGDVGPLPGRAAVFDSIGARLDLTDFDLALAPVVTGLSGIFPTGSSELDRELLRAFGMLQPVNRELLDKILGGITPKSAPPEDIHRLMVLAMIEVERTYEQSVATAAALVNLDVKIYERRLKQDANWDDRIGELYKRLCEVDPAIRQVIVEQPNFGFPGHVLLLSQVSEDKLPAAIEHFVQHINQSDDFDWSNDVVFVIGESDVPEHRNLIRDQLDNLAVQGAVLMVLAEDPSNDDRQLFIEGLTSGQVNVVESCLQALTGLPPGRTPDEHFALLAVGRRLINSAREFSLREKAMRLLQRNTSQSFGFVFGEDGHRPQPAPLQQWGEWMRKKYPKFSPPGEGAAAADQLLAEVDGVHWDAGDVQRGELLFRKLACAKCHGGRRALGPDLTGVAKRFSRRDLFAAIVDPNRDVSPRYQTTSIVTTDGKTYTGLIVYESVDGLLLRDSSHQTWRIEAPEIEARRKQAVSLMPSGLLKDQPPSALADLYRYLQGL